MLKPIRVEFSEAVLLSMKTLFKTKWTDTPLEKIPNHFYEVTRSDRPDLADYQCNGALPLSKLLKKNPREVAQVLLTELQGLLGGVDLTIAGPGFLNFKLKGDFLAGRIDTLLSDAKTDSRKRLGIPLVQQPEKIIIDYGGPNVAKTMHVAHLRSSIIGDALVRVNRFLGHEVIGDNHLGDWGTPMGMLICSLQDLHPQWTYFDENFSGPYPTTSPVSISDLEELYPKASLRFKEDKDFEQRVLKATDELQKGRAGYYALWKHFTETTVAELNSDFSKLGVSFDTWYGESFYEDKMPEMVKDLIHRGLAVESEGAMVMHLSDLDAQEMPPLILVKKGGGFLYHTSDLATVRHRIDALKANRILYVVDKRQSLHFKQVFKAAEKAGYSQKVSMEHVAFGTMNGTDGKPFKTRAGGVLKLRELLRMAREKAEQVIDEAQSNKEEKQSYSDAERESIAHKVTVATLRYADLKNNRTSDYVFDLDKFCRFEGNTGPYLLYATVRIQSILKKAKEVQLVPGKILGQQGDSLAAKAERELMLTLLLLPEAIEKVSQKNEPHHLCDFGFELAQKFNSFYQNCHILKEAQVEKAQSWLSLCLITYEQLILVQSLLGIEVPERM